MMRVYKYEGMDGWMRDAMELSSVSHDTRVYKDGDDQVGDTGQVLDSGAAEMDCHLLLSKKRGVLP